MKCSQCGNEFVGNFCPNCGAKADNIPLANTINAKEGNYNTSTSNGAYSNIPNQTIYNGSYIPTDGSETPQRVKKPLHKKWWFWLIIIIVFFMLVGMFSPSESENANDTVSQQTAATTENEAQNKTEKAAQPQTTTKKAEVIVAKTTTEAKPNVSLEYSNALAKARIYAKDLHMSKSAVYEQLTSEYGEQFPEDAAQYAIDNLTDIDWNEVALAKARTYQEDLHMSKAAIYDQLVSEYGEKFTEQQAQYAIDHLN